MARRVFFSFHYHPDCWRASQVRNIGVIDGNVPATDNDWEKVTRCGDGAIKTWIASQLAGRSCTVVLVGENTAGRKWINHEIAESWNACMGLVGVRIHGLKDRRGYTSSSGSNPFDHVTFTKSNKPLSSVVKLYDPTDFFCSSTETYGNIRNNLVDWIEEAIEIRNKY